MQTCKKQHFTLNFFMLVFPHVTKILQNNACYLTDDDFNLLQLQCISQNFWQTVSKVRLKFPKFTTNLATSLRSCQSNRKLGNEVVNFMPNFAGKLRGSLQEKFTPFSVNVWIFPDVIQAEPKNRIQFLLCRFIF